LLLTEPEELTALLNSVKNTDQYEPLKRSLITMDASFELIIIEFEKSNPENIDLSKEYLHALSGKDLKLNGHILESFNNQGDKISIDMSQYPPNRTLALADSDYAMDANHSI
jgi:hypothetical protein